MVQQACVQKYTNILHLDHIFWILFLNLLSKDTVFLQPAQNIFVFKLYRVFSALDKFFCRCTILINVLLTYLLLDTVFNTAINWHNSANVTLFLTTPNNSFAADLNCMNFSLTVWLSRLTPSKPGFHKNLLLREQLIWYPSCFLLNLHHIEIPQQLQNLFLDLLFWATFSWYQFNKVNGSLSPTISYT